MSNFLGSDIFNLTHNLLAWAFIAAAFLSVIFILYGGLSFILSGGDEEKVQKAVASIRNAIIGLVIIIISVTIIAFVGRIFGVELLFIQFDVVLQQVNQIISSISATR